MIDIAREERVLRITLNRPERKNALNSAMCQSLLAALESAANDAETGAILIEARGEVFCAGMDLEEATGPDAAGATEIHARLFTAGARIPKPIIAAVNGPALGGGVGLIANAHIVVAAHGASFGLTEIRVGMWPFVIWHAMVRSVGERRALALALTGRLFSVNEALQWGLVHEVTPPFELEDRALAIALHASESSPEAIRIGMQFVSKARELPEEQAIQLALREREKVFSSAAFAEGVAAFREKRKPVWPR